MVARIKTLVAKLKRYEPGERFQAYHREQAQQSVGVRILFCVLALVSFALGVLFAFIPGPAVLFFALTGALLATQSAGVARLMDRLEVIGRRWLESYRAWRGRRRLAAKR